MTTMPITLAQLNAAPLEQALAWLDGLYEHSPWIAEQALAKRPFASLAQLEYALVGVVRDAGRDAQLALVRAHPELAGKAAIAGALTAESTHEQAKVGLGACSAEQFARLAQLNADYNAKFGFPFILAQGEELVVRIGERPTTADRHEARVTDFREDHGLYLVRISRRSVNAAGIAAIGRWSRPPTGRVAGRCARPCRLLSRGLS